MGIWDKLRGELVDIVEWLDDTRDTIVWRFPRYENQIKYGAKLIVREGQVAAFVNQGALADVFKPGTYTLQTSNLPILSTLLGWKYGFDSPFKAEVYFVNTRPFTDQKWGTKNPIMLRDAEFGPVRLRAFGTFSFHVIDPAAFLRQVVSTSGVFTVELLQDQLRDMISARFADALAQSKIPTLDLAGNYDQVGKSLTGKMSADFEPYGIQVMNLLVENVSLPPEVEAAIDKRSSMGVIGNLQAFTAYQTANAIPDAAKNPGGLAGAGLGIAVGYNMAGQLAGAAGAAANVQQSPPPLPGSVSYYIGINGQQLGPLDATGLRDKITSGQLTRETLVWKAGMTSWIAAGQVQELTSMFGAVPPPLPPQK